MNEDRNRKIFVYSITSRQLGFDFNEMFRILVRETGLELRGCRFIPRTVMKNWHDTGINCYFILLDNPLPTPMYIMKHHDNFITRPYTIVQTNEFEVTWKKKSKNKDHILFGTFGSDSFITHYAESIIENLNKLKLCKEVRL